MKLLNLILKSTGKKGVPQGGVVSASSGKSDPLNSRNSEPFEKSGKS
jgi:hypothetical protein